MKRLFWGLIFLSSLGFFVYLGSQYVFRTRASGLNLALKLKLQGNYRNDTKIQFRIDLYSGSLKIATFNGAQLSYSENKVFEGIVMLNQELDLSKPYAIFIKPEKYLGQLFCSPTEVGESCTTGKFNFISGLNSLDISNQMFYAGDLAPQDGKVDSADISKILAKIGKTDAITDINQDGIVNSIDYTLTQRTLSLNKADDEITLVSPTILPSPTSAPKVTTLPSPTSAPTATTAPQSVRGRCEGIITGEVRVKYLGITECRVVEEEDYRCVNSASECTKAACIQYTKAEIEETLARCGHGLASFDEANSPLNCEVKFVPEANCTDPVQDTSCDDTSEKCN